MSNFLKLSNIKVAKLYKFNLNCTIKLEILLLMMDKLKNKNKRYKNKRRIISKQMKAMLKNKMKRMLLILVASRNRRRMERNLNKSSLAIVRIQSRINKVTNQKPKMLKEAFLRTPKESHPQKLIEMLEKIQQALK